MESWLQIFVLSKYAWVVLLKSKSGFARLYNFTDIFKQGRKPERLQTDAGTEFTNRSFQTFLKNHDVHHFVTYETKAQVVERFNRTLNHLLWRLFTMSSSYHYLDKLDNLVNENYNESIHHSIKMKPADETVFNAQDVLCMVNRPRPQSINSRRVIMSRSVSINECFRKGTSHLGQRNPLWWHKDFHETHPCTV